MKRIATIAMALALALSSTVAVFAHGGRTDSNGGHKDNKNASGLGSYHYHCGGYPAHLHPNGVCPYATGTTTSSSQSAEEEETGTAMTLSFSFGQTAGIYAGETQSGVPHGKGQFTATNADGSSWSYEGDWSNGHMQGTGITKWNIRDYEYGQYTNDVRNKKVAPTSQEYLTEKEIDTLFGSSAQLLCGRPLSLSGQIAIITEVENGDKDLILTVKLTQPEFKYERYVDLYIDRAVVKNEAFQIGQAVSASGIFYGQRVIQNTEPVITYTYIPKVYVI